MADGRSERGEAVSEPLKPCPFCGNKTPEFERLGDWRRSCVVACGGCGARHVSGDEGKHNGSSWNERYGNGADPRSIPSDIRTKLIRLRDALVRGSVEDAYHEVYSIADPEFTSFTPWEALEVKVESPELPATSIDAARALAERIAYAVQSRVTSEDHPDIKVMCERRTAIRDQYPELSYGQVLAHCKLDWLTERLAEFAADVASEAKVEPPRTLTWSTDQPATTGHYWLEIDGTPYLDPVLIRPWGEMPSDSFVIDGNPGDFIVDASGLALEGNFRIAGPIPGRPT